MTGYKGTTAKDNIRARGRKKEREPPGGQKPVTTKGSSPSVEKCAQKPKRLD